MSVFTRFTHNFVSLIWKYRSIFLILFAFLIGGALIIAYAENLPFGDALYFSFITGLTIGYGDIAMKTSLGRCVAILLGFIGVLFTGLVIAAAVEAVRKTHD
jgi:uncharacterized membrane protein